MVILLDTNILGRYFDRSDQHHQQTCDALEHLTGKDHLLCYVPQIEAEFISIGTRKREDNGLGLSPQAAEQHLDQMQKTFALRFPDAETQWRHFRTIRRELIEKRLPVISKRTHDLRLVSACRAANIPAILTYNVKDFRSIAESGYITVLTPDGDLPE